jgi:hypothetical protein
VSDLGYAVGVGLLGGAVGWLLAQLLVSPRLRWSTFVIRNPDEEMPSGYSYQLKFKNASWFRSAVGFEFRPRIHFKHSNVDDRGRERSSISKSLRMDVTPADAHRVRARGNLILTFWPHEVDDNTLDRLRKWGYSDEVLERTRSLEDLMRLPEAFFSVQVVVTDSWSGVAHYLESPHYTLGSGATIRPGSYVATRGDIEYPVRKFQKARSAVRQRWQVSRIHTRLNPELQHAGTKPPGQNWEADRPRRR